MPDPTETLLERALERKLEDRLGGLFRQISGMEEDLGRMQTTVSVLAHRAGVGPDKAGFTEDDAAETHQPDQVWGCQKCRTRLGLYDPEADVVRVRYKDHQCYIRVGVGGFLRVICRTCGEVNVLNYAPPADMGAIQVLDGVAVLTAEVLEELLSRAQASGGEVQVRLELPGA